MAREGPDVAVEVPAARRHRADENPRRRLGQQDPHNRDGWLPKRGRPPEGKLNEDAARGALQAFLDQQTDRTPLERITFERCADAFLESCREKGRSPTTLRT
jgi:hypothetical protein